MTSEYFNLIRKCDVQYIPLAPRENIILQHDGIPDHNSYTDQRLLKCIVSI
jgi:hypothetical protein